MLKSLSATALKKSQGSYKNLIHIIHTLPDISSSNSTSELFESAKSQIENFSASEEAYLSVVQRLTDSVGLSSCVTILQFLIEVSADCNQVSLTQFKQFIGVENKLR